MSYFQPYSASRAKEEAEAKAMPQAVEEGEVVVEGVVHSFDAIEAAGPAGTQHYTKHTHGLHPIGGVWGMGRGLECASPW